MDVNVLSVLYITQHYLEDMIQLGKQLNNQLTTQLHIPINNPISSITTK